MVATPALTTPKTPKTPRAPKGWTKRVQPGTTYPVVYTREVGTRTFRIAPDTFDAERWTVDVAWCGLYERFTNQSFGSPAEAAAQL